MCIRDSPAVALAQRLGHAAAAGGEVAASLALGGDARQAVGHRFAVDHQDALVAVLDFRQIALCHDLLAAMLGEGLEDHREVRVAFAVTKYRRTAHSVQGFENDVTMLGGKLAQNIGSPADHRRRSALGELRGEELLVAVAQALRPVHHQGAGTLGLFQQVGRIDEFVIEGRVLAHQDHVQFVQRLVAFRFQFEPAGGIVEDLQRAHASTRDAGLLVEVLLFHVEQRPAAGLGSQQHGERAVLLEVDARDGVHDDPEAYAHGNSSERGWVVRSRRGGRVASGFDAQVGAPFALGQGKSRPVPGIMDRVASSVLKRPAIGSQPVGDRALAH
ncbi:hypothetical protein PAERUG_E16_London_17_VIM_2_04_14_02649 [Pseudomonas aeruginosa]|nr:hypothetical protein PAERUG_E16_London_17_VIM_2_04_14_02649 [Pseudomonas aeruginosa]